MALSSILSSESSTSQFWTATGLGVAIHYAVFNRGEWHIKAPHVLSAHLLLSVIIFGLQLSAPSKTIANACFDTCCICSGYLGAILASVATYRAFFHRLRGFPGPPIAKISKLWHVYQVRDGKNYLFLEDMRKQYGQFVRTGKVS